MNYKFVACDLHLLIARQQSIRLSYMEICRFQKGMVINMDRHITVPMSAETAVSLHAGDYVFLDGIIYTARDAAHKRMEEALEKGEPLPVALQDNVI